MMAASIKGDYIMLSLKNARSVLFEGFGWPFTAPHKSHRETRPEAPAELDAAICYDIGFSDLNAATIRKQPRNSMRYSRSLEAMLQRRP
jgi:hypothetical protein